MTLRNERVRKELMREIADILQKEIRTAGMTSIMDVEVSHDNSFAKVYYSVFGSDEQKQKTIETIEKNTSKIRYEIGKRIRLRLTPELRFIYDDSIERGTKVTDLINKISRGEIK
ncbi:MAG TPA: 30S ribosome-binding factor RbfA [Candidatus Gastranaerophilaceae bacterium]|nr:30S ribosome-binding factor RbfA [Candidatus Gastranaerophilaceae bacterium]HPT41296.1 30S ribosome-binding factor RbfA [Candidatus Gastranaerophilaceae bacterium]